MDAIPQVEDPGRWEERDFTHSGFIQLLSNNRIDVRMQYPLLGMGFAEPRCYARTEIYDRLLEAAGHLPEGWRLGIWDAWRPFALQNELYVVYSKQIVRAFGLEDCPPTRKREVIRRFVSEPMKDRAMPPVHTTGGAVDVTLIDETGNELDMGTGFDAFTDLTRTAAFENGMDSTIRDNRRLLYHAMTSAGFANLPSEWWHYDYGDRFWAYYKKKPAMYEGIFTGEELYGK